MPPARLSLGRLQVADLLQTLFVRAEQDVLAVVERAARKFDRACAGRMGQVGARFVVFPPWVEHPIEQADGTSVLTIMATHAEALPW